MSNGTHPTFGRYRLIREIGRGGEATVHLAEDPVLRRTVALKVFPPSLAGGRADPPAGFSNEVDVLSRLEHPGICTIYDAGIQDDCAYIAMSYVEGRTLAEIGPLRPEEAARIVAEVAATLSAAHAVGIVHGDLTPANVLVTHDGRPVLLDFGVARFLDASARGPRHARLAGTLPYVAPECLTSAPDVRSDVFGLGAVLFELLTGRPPFSAPTRAALIGEISRHDAPLLRALAPAAPKDLEAVVNKAIARNPMRRYATVDELAADLQRFRKGERVSARRYGPLARAARSARRRPAVAALIAFFAVFLAVAIPLAAVKNRKLGKELERADVEARRAAVAARAAEDSVVRYERLADRRRLQDLEARAARLVPPSKALVPELRAWLGDADALLERLDEHRRALEEVRSRAQPAASRPDDQRPASWLARNLASLQSRLAALGAADPAARHLRSLVGRIESSLPPAPVRPDYDDQADAIRDETLSGLIEDLVRFADPDRFHGTRADVAHRLEEARALEAAAAANAGVWAAAIASIANETECPRYRGLRLTPQEGLVPLRRDPASGLWEFVHVLSGEAPRPSESGGWKLSQDSGIVLVLIPGATARIGSRLPVEGEPKEGPYVDLMASPAETPPDDVPLDPFFISKYEMTEAQWVRLRGAIPRVSAEVGARLRSGLGDLLPLTSVDWYEAHDAVMRVGLDLPTEAQWEYAARAGTTTPWITGSDTSTLARQAVFGTENTSTVGRREPNAFGLHDVIGNAAEWCLDVYARYDEDPRLAGTGERFGLDEREHRIRRGGSYLSKESALRTARRDIHSPSARFAETGIRPARKVDR